MRRAVRWDVRVKTQPNHPDPAPAALDVSAWIAGAEAALGAPVEVLYGRSRQHPVQLARGRAGRDGLTYRLRLHRFFSWAPEAVRDDLFAWLRAGRRARAASDRLDHWIAEQLADLPPAAPRAVRLEPVGRTCDLAQISAEVAARPSAGPVRGLSPRPPIGWGRWPTRPPKRRLQLGAFDAGRCVIRIHPILDDERVPRDVVDYVVFHELLHAAIGDRDAGRHHGPLFRAAEQAYAGTASACAWVDNNTSTLLRRVARRVRQS